MPTTTTSSRPASPWGGPEPEEEAAPEAGSAAMVARSGRWQANCTQAQQVSTALRAAICCGVLPPATAVAVAVATSLADAAAPSVAEVEAVSRAMWWASLRRTLLRSTPWPWPGLVGERVSGSRAKSLPSSKRQLRKADSTSLRLHENSQEISYEKVMQRRMSMRREGAKGAMAD